MDPYRASSILSSSQHRRHGSIVILIMSLYSWGCGTDCESKFKRIYAFFALEVVVLYEDLKEGFVELFVVGGIFENARGDTVEQRKVSCSIFLSGCFSALINMSAGVSPAVSRLEMGIQKFHEVRTCAE